MLFRVAANDNAQVELSTDNKTKRDEEGGLRWNNLGVSLESCDGYDGDCSDDSMWLLHPSSGFVKNGCLCGILGPSGKWPVLSGSRYVLLNEPFIYIKTQFQRTHQGAGKTTFLNALGGTTPSSSGIYLTGSVWYEGLVQLDDAKNNTSQMYQRHLSQQDGDIAMLSQHDNFFQMLTPRESLELAAYFEVLKQQKMDPAIKDNHKELAERKLSLLGLSSVADHRIGDRTRIGGGSGGRGWLSKSSKLFSKVKRSGGLSGGERRRLSVALELVTEPKIFLADEPTTGLDSAQAEKVVKLIAKLGKERSIPSVIILHQPKSKIWQTLVGLLSMISYEVDQYTYVTLTLSFVMNSTRTPSYYLLPEAKCVTLAADRMQCHILQNSDMNVLMM